MTPLSPKPKPKVLIVDDDAGVRSTIERYLSFMGYEVGTATSGNDALIMVGDAMPDLILLDIAMPIMDGINTLRQLHEKGVTSPVVMLNTLAETQTAQQALNYGARDFLTKPIELPALKKILQTHLGPAR